MSIFSIPKRPFLLFPEQDEKLLFLDDKNLTSKCSSLNEKTEFGQEEVLKLLKNSRNQTFWKYSDADFLKKRWSMWNDELEKYRRYFRSEPVSKEEENYPLAYIFMVNEHLEAVEELLQL